MNEQFISFVSGLSKKLEHSHRYRTARAYSSAARSIYSCFQYEITLKELYTSSTLKKYEEYLITKGCKRNTISFYMRMLRSVYNQAFREGYIKPVPHIFEHVFTGTDVTPKRALPASEIGRLRILNLDNEPELAFSRDMFMLSFYLQGIPFVDLAYLKKSDLHENLITYRRTKTKRMVIVVIHPRAQQIIDRYTLSDNASSPYLLPVIACPGYNEHKQYQTALKKYNRNLNRLAKMLNLSGKLTSYTARHSWATTAYYTGVPTSVISQGLGHRTEEITQIYLAAFNNDVLLAANDNVVAAILPEDKNRRRFKNNARHL